MVFKVLCVWRLRHERLIPVCYCGGDRGVIAWHSCVSHSGGNRWWPARWRSIKRQDGGDCSWPGDSAWRSSPCSLPFQVLMRAIALSVWLFLNLGFFGMCGYIYLLWAQNWRSNTRRVYDLTPKSSYDPKDPVIFYEPVDKRNKSMMKRKWHEETHPRITSVAKTRKRKCDGDACDEKLQALKNEVLLQMRRVLHDESSVFKTDNPYHVAYRGQRAPLAGFSSSEVRCRLRGAGLRTLTRQDPPFDHLPLGALLGDGDVFRGRRFGSCAVVSNAAALLDSRSGPIIGIPLRLSHSTDCQVDGAD